MKYSNCRLPVGSRALAGLGSVLCLVAACAGSGAGEPDAAGGQPSSATGGAANASGAGGGVAGGAVSSAGSAGSGTAGQSGVAGSAGAPAGAGGQAGAGTGGAGGSAGGSVPPGRPGWTLAWSDEFDGTVCPDTASWRFESGFVRNEELQWYQPDNASCQAGMLVIEARRESKPNPNYLAGSTDWRRNRQTIQYTSSSMTTSGRHTFTYGRFEMRGRIDTHQGSWPAFWTLGSGVGWPASGEVDIMEYYAGNVLANVCLPMGSTCGWSSIRQPLTRLGGAAFTSAFHVWAMEWDATNIDLFLDDALVNHFVVADAVAAGQTNPYVGKAQYMLLNFAIGGINGGDPTNTAFPLRYEVDYVRVYQRAQ